MDSSIVKIRDLVSRGSSFMDKCCMVDPVLAHIMAINFCAKIVGKKDLNCKM